MSTHAGLILAAILSMSTTVIGQQDADLVLIRGTIFTMNDDQPQAEALAIRGDRILAVGTEQQVAAYVGPKTHSIDLKGRLAIPGFIESHGHFVSLGRSKMVLDLSLATTWEEIVNMVAEAARAAPTGTWIIGRGWHQGKWRQRPQPHVEGYPVHASLSRRTPRHPVLLTHGSGHMAFANRLAMQLANTDKDSPEAAGGEILRLASGEPTGALRENAADPVYAAHGRSQQQQSPEQRRQDLLTAIRLASEECLANGVTSFQDAGCSFGTIDVFRDLARNGQLRVRLWGMLNEGNHALQSRMADYRIIGEGSHHLTVRAIKRLIDGALGTHGAWMLEPYDDLPSGLGHNTTSPKAVRATADLAMRHDFQMCVHAIGDRANRVVLDIFAQAAEQQPDRELRWRIEHAQHLHPSDIPRFATLGVIASMQGVHCTSDGPFVVQRLGKQRAKNGAYAWRSLLDQNARIINGTDTPVERISPIQCFYASVTRQLADGSTFFPEQRMTRSEAIRTYTRDAAFGAFEEHLKGSLQPGRLADIVVLSKNIMTVPVEQIPSTKVLYTIIGGEVRYQAETDVALESRHTP